MSSEAVSRRCRGRGQSLSLLWLLLLPPLATRGLRGSLPMATPALAPGETLEGGAPTPSAQPLARGAPAHLLPPFQLKEGKVGLIENKFCNMLYGQRLGKGRTYSVHEEMLCAGDFLTGKAICRGDSGGPLICDLLSSWVLVGLASWGLDCRHPIYPSVFTSVIYFADWISKIQRRTPLLDPSTALPQTQFPYRPLHAVGSPGPGRAPMPPHTWIPLLFVLRAW
ncbi:putative serine protease 47 [Hipposideros larvatus]